MEAGKKSGLAFILIVMGALILLGKLGILSQLFGFVMPLALIGLGYVGIKNGKTKFGWLFAAIGCFILFVKLSGFFVLVFAAAMICWGISLLKKRTEGAAWGERL